MNIVPYTNANGLSRDRQEDGITILHYPDKTLFIVIDGASGAYVGQPKRHRMENRFLTGGQCVRQIVIKTFTQADPDDDLLDVLVDANRRVKSFSQSNGYDLSDTDALPVAVVAIARISGHCIEVIQNGDSLVLWQDECGIRGGTSSQIFHHDQVEDLEFDRLVKETRDKDKAQRLIMPYRAEARRKNFNTLEGGISVINGQREFLFHLRQFEMNLAPGSFLLLATDGCFPPSKMENGNSLATEIFPILLEGGFSALEEWTHRIVWEKNENPHLGGGQTGEASALLIAL